MSTRYPGFDGLEFTAGELATERREHSFENHIEDEIIELINAGRAISANAVEGRMDRRQITRFELAAENAARELAMTGRDIIPKLDKSHFEMMRWMK